MKKSMVLTLLLTLFYQAAASESYNKMRHVIRQHMSTKQGKPHDLTEYKAKVLFSRYDVFGIPEEILQLSDAAFKLLSDLTDEEKTKLPQIVVAKPGSYAMKFCSYAGHCKIITAEQPTVEDLEIALNVY